MAWLSPQGPASWLAGVLAPLLVAASGAVAAPVTPPSAAVAPEPSCQQAITTVEMQECLEAEVRRLDLQLSRYLAAAQRREARLAAEEARPAADLAATQRLWWRYRDAHCLDLYRHWSGGSIRGVMALSCRQALARERLRRIWSDYLTYPDGSPPLLPDPERQVPAARPAPQRNP